MKKLILTLILAVIAVPAMAQDHSNEHGHDGGLNPVESQYICMMNNRVFETPQIAVEIEGKTYYGCCPMCADKLKNDASLRSAVDPVSGNTVDKSEAVIGADADKAVYYFENEENMHTYSGAQNDLE